MPVYRCSQLLAPAGAGPGAVALRDDRVVAVGPLREVLLDSGETEWRDLGDAIVLPGLVNAHTHLELSYMGQDPPPGGDFATWIEGLVERRANEDPQTARRAAEQARDAMAARGTVAAGDVCNDTWIAEVWDDGSFEGVLFHELLSIDDRESAQRFKTAREHLDARPAPEGWRWSIVPHTPYTVSLSLMRVLAAHARRAGLPFSVHLAESPAEVEFLATGGGLFRDLFERRGFVTPGFEPAGCRPLERVESAGIPGPNALLVHAVQLTGDEIERLGRSGATVVTCPRSNHYLDVGIAPVPALLDAGANLALGTDSLASNPDLDLFAEMAALRDTHPGLDPAKIVTAATLGGATALGLTETLGTIEPGKSARLTVVPFAATGDPLEFLCSNPQQVFPLDDAPYETRP
ncbi:MAG: amidohydrolase family protein [Acidobacteria bacterium]|nr:amidohydrolase family protein [Acidobacteriota bacterium]NIM62667.1 amidohydrolase family protein [Acidobacteriota bacterium]NIO59907.1 amidohydrolase family protein [Acidobacteriota bacterium]NIQ86081.1 amidohydrolase family protein [Acidobacteriota bacterium]NIT11597.1 amidohydrolase family protein [Acidobacteriota bacterium]